MAKRTKKSPPPGCLPESVLLEARIFELWETGHADQANALFWKGIQDHRIGREAFELLLTQQAILSVKMVQTNICMNILKQHPISLLVIQPKMPSKH